MLTAVGLAQILLVGLALYFVLLVLYTIWGLSHPPRQTYASAVSKGIPGDPSELDKPLDYKEHTIDGSKAKLAVWDITGAKPDGPTVIMTHGWGSSRIAGLKRIQAFTNHASRMILWDLPGHGDSQGNTNLGASEHNDLESIIQWTDPKHQLVLVGWSMGAGVSLAYANQASKADSLAGIICEAPYIDPLTPARNVIRLRGVPFRFNLPPTMWILGMLFGVGPKWTGFARDEHAKAIKEPILILHGSNDPVCPIAHGQQIKECAHNAQLGIIDAGGHNNLWTDEVFQSQMVEQVDAFFARLE